MGLFSFFNRGPSELRAPEALVLPDGRKRLTRFFSVAHSSRVTEKLDLDWGTVDEGTAPTGWEGLRLVGRSQSDEVTRGGRDTTPMLVLVYEQIDDEDETQVGEVETTKLEDGRTALVYQFIQFSTGTYVPGTVGTSTAPGDANAYLLKEEAPDDGTLRRIKRTYVYAGKLSERTFRRGTILAKTVVYAKTVPPTPSGYVLVDDQQVESPNGYPIYTYTFFATSDAGYSVERYVPFTYPGRAKAFVETYGGRTMMDIFKSAPVTTPVKATITVSYQTGSTLGSISDLWNPTEWATQRAQWIGFGDNAHNLVTELPGYRAVDDTPLEQASDNVVPIELSIFGNPVYGGTTARIVVTGGPEAPDGNTYTLDAFIDDQPAFVAADGTKYYRKTLVTATIPAQPTLPV